MSGMLSEAARHDVPEPDFDAVREAAARIAPYVRRTPVLHDELLDEELGAEVFFKCENLQRGGAFKFRGATNAVQSLAATVTGVATHSSGNHGTALAIAAQRCGIPAAIVMPRNTAAVKIAAVRRAGAEVILCEPGLIGRESALAQLLRERRLEVIHPYDDERVIAGQGTAALEFLDQQSGLELLMTPVSGGGLISGTAIAAKGVNAAIRVIGVEPELADDACRSFRSGERVVLDAPQTIADGLRASLGVRNFAIIRRLVDDMASVSEDAIMAAARLVLERLKILIEPSAAVPVAALLERKVEPRGARVGIILSGGNLDLDGARWLTGVP
ncbi:MAG TPA: pyridoxal-phosphate dependent enzyme [Steroidobacteraceae bacterium]|nr:pyridoxal-phosphate dependent enzyme [Steroidobacteraceae bacterium]